MLLRGNIFNFYNKVKTVLKDDSKVLWLLSTHNSNFTVTSPLDNNYDSLNFSGSFFCLKKKTYFTKFKYKLYKIFLTQWVRVTLRGKSYRVKCFKRKKKFTFNLGYSHLTKFKANSLWNLFRKRRQNYLVFTYTIKDLFFFKRELPYVRFYNCYTMRGLRLKRQPIIRRFGKISQHVSILH